MIIKTSFCAMAVVALSTSFAWAGSTVTLRDKQQAACYDDVQRLCGQFVPDVDKTEACMKDKRPQVSTGCAKYFDMDQPG